MTARHLILLTSTIALVASLASGNRPAAPSSPQALPDPGPAASKPMAELDEMDTRTPIPLLPMMASHQKQQMRDHLAAVQEIVAALASDDLAAVAKSADRIGYSEQMGQMCTHMGAGAPGFTEQALAFHHAADKIGVAAREGDRKRALNELDTTLRACTSCHATWKQQVVDEPTWRRLTSSGPPTPGHR